MGRDSGEKSRVFILKSPIALEKHSTSTTSAWGYHCKSSANSLHVSCIFFLRPVISLSTILIGLIPRKQRPILLVNINLCFEFPSPTSNARTHFHLPLLPDTENDLLTMVLPHAKFANKFVVSLGRRLGVVTWEDRTKDAADAAFELLYECDETLKKNRLNDGKCDKRGRLWAGEFMSNISTMICFAVVIM